MVLLICVTRPSPAGRYLVTRSKPESYIVYDFRTQSPAVKNLLKETRLGRSMFYSFVRQVEEKHLPRREKMDEGLR